MMMKKSVVVGVAAIVVAGAGLATVVIGSGDGDTTGKSLAVAQVNEGQATIPPDPTQAQQAFETMAVEEAGKPECELPVPPKSIGQTALTRNSLRQVLRIMALERGKEVGSCECFYDDVGWDDVLAAAPRFERTDGVDLRFDLASLRAQADELETQRQTTCSE